MIKKIEEGLYVMDTEVDLTFSPDDGGWYFIHFPEYYTSKIYSTRAKALEAYNNKTIEWEEKAS